MRGGAWRLCLRLRAGGKGVNLAVAGCGAAKGSVEWILKAS